LLRVQFFANKHLKGTPIACWVPLFSEGPKLSDQRAEQVHRARSAASLRARCRSDRHRPRRSRRAAAARRTSSRGTARALSFPVPLTRHVSAALVRLWLRLQRSEGGVAAKKPQNQEWPFAAFSGCASRPVVKRASRARSHAALCVWRRRLPLHSPRWDFSGARHRLASHCPRRRRRRDRRAAALGMSVLCCSRMPFAHGPHRLWTAAACAQLLAAGVAGDKWQIQKWPFATVSASVARSVVWCDLVCRVLLLYTTLCSLGRTVLVASCMGMGFVLSL
jgi:hypothetical protein